MAVAASNISSFSETSNSSSLNLIPPQMLLSHYYKPQNHIQNEDKEKSLKSVTHKRPFSKNNADEVELEIDNDSTTNKTPVKQSDWKRKRITSPLILNPTNQSLQLDNIVSTTSSQTQSHFLPSVSFGSVAAAALQHQSNYFFKYSKN